MYEKYSFRKDFSQYNMYCMLTWHCLATGNLNVARPALKKSWYLALKSFLRKLQTATHNQLSPLAKLSRLHCEIILLAHHRWQAQSGHAAQQGGPKIFEKIELLAPEVCGLKALNGIFEIVSNKEHKISEAKSPCSHFTQKLTKR